MQAFKTAILVTGLVALAGCASWEKALANGGLSGAHAMGAADTKLLMPNTTDAGRAKNRRVEITVTK